MRNATAVFACCVTIAVVPATIRAEPSAAELETLIKEFEKLRGKDRAEGAEIILARIDTLMLEAEKRLEFNAAAKFARQGASIARGIKCPRQRDYNLQASEYNRLTGWLGRMKLLAETLKKKPDNADARRRLITVYMVQLDNPGAAAKFVTDGVDEHLRTIVGLARKSTGALDESELLALADWYAKSASATAVRALLRARAYYKAFLETTEKRDATYLKAKRGLKSVLKLLEKARPPLVGKIDPGKAWVATVYVREGDDVAVSAKGTWTLKFRLSGLLGRRGGRWGRGRGNTMRRRGIRLTVTPNGGEGTAGRYYLAGRIGDGQEFKIGSSWSGTGQTAGALSIGVRGGPIKSCSGALTVVVRKYPRLPDRTGGGQDISSGESE